MVKENPYFIPKENLPKTEEIRELEQEIPTFSIEYSFSCSSNFFEIFGIRSRNLKISGSLDELHGELQKLESGAIKVVCFDSLTRSYERSEYWEEEVKSCVREKIGEFEEIVRNKRTESYFTGFLVNICE